MSLNTFFLQLGGVTLLVCLMLFGLHQFSSFQPYADISFISLLFFLFFNIFMFFAGRKLAVSQDKYVFSRLALGSMLAKMFLAVLVLFIYDKTMEPSSEHFVFIFILVYLPYTIFETHFMMRLGNP